MSHEAPELVWVVESGGAWVATWAGYAKQHNGIAYMELEAAAKLAFDAVLTLENSNYQYSALQKAACVAAVIRNKGKG